VHCGPSHITINILSVKSQEYRHRRVLSMTGPCPLCCGDAAQAYAIASVVVVVSGLTAMEFLSHWGACSYNTITSDKQSARTEHCEAEPKSTGEEGAFARFMYGRGGIEVDGKAPPVAVHGSVSPAL
jgi:hypothetical protein